MEEEGDFTCSFFHCLEAEDVKVLALKCHQEIVQHFETEVGCM